MAQFWISASKLFRRIDGGLLLSGLLTLFIIQPLLQPGLPTTADMPIHLYRTLEYGDAWSASFLLPSWASNLAYGYGYPLFIFAPPLPYLIGFLFHELGLTVELALKLLIMLTIMVYATGMYLLVRDTVESVHAGLIAATAYAFAPFALRESLLYGGNVPQFLAIALFPWTLWSLTRLSKHQTWGWAMLTSLFYAALILSHLFHALIFSPVLAAYGLLLWLMGRVPLKADRNSTLCQFRALRRLSLPKPVSTSSTYGFLRFGVASFITSLRLYLAPLPLGLLMTTFFWLPAFLERGLTRAQADIYLDKSPFFIRYPHWTELISLISPLDARAANPHVPLTLGLITLILAGLGTFRYLFGFIRSWKNRPNINMGQPPPTSHLLPPTFYLLLSIATLFMTLQISRPVWETITILQVAEFPWRLLGLANLGLAFLAGSAILLIPQRQRGAITLICLMLQIASVSPLLYPVTPFTQYGEPTLADQIDYERRSQSIGTTTLGEYLPQTVEIIPTGSPLVEAFRANQQPERLDRTSLPPTATATRLKQTALDHHYQLTSPEPFRLRLLHFDYPGWQATLDDQPLEISHEAQTGLMLLDIPSGDHVLRVEFGLTAMRWLAYFISGLTVIGLLMSGLLWNRFAFTQAAPVEVEFEPLDRRLFPSRSAFISLALMIGVAALWLKPQLRPLLTVNSPAGKVLMADEQSDIEFEQGISLIGYDLAPKIVAPNGRMELILYWQAKHGAVQANLQPFVHLDRLDDFTTVAETTNYTPGDVTTESVLPTFHWDAARYVRDEHALIIPADTVPIAYAVRVGLIDSENGQLLRLVDGYQDTAMLTVINVSGEPCQTTSQAQLCAAMSPRQVTFGDHIKMTGVALTQQTADRLGFTLAWETGQRLKRDYTVFAQLLDQAGQLVVSYDSPPMNGAYPTSTWLPQQTILERRFIPLDVVTAGEYQLIVGLYEPESGLRLLTAEGKGFTQVASVKIGE